MKANFRTAVTASVALIMVAPLSRAQDRDLGDSRRFGDFARNDACVRGEIASGAEQESGLTVELRGLGSRAGMPQHGLVGVSGSFDLRECMPAGEYHLQVVNGRGQILHYEIVSLHSGANSIRIALREERSERPVSGMVSVRQLQRKIDPKAKKELRKAHDAVERKDFVKAIAYAENALTRDPTFAEAHIELGVVYVNMNQYDRAADEFSKAGELDPDSALAHSNLAVAMLRLQRNAEAEQAARRALKVNNSLRHMEYALGVSLSLQGRNPAEAIECLQRAAREYPRARLYAAHVLAEAGRHSDAANELKEYLRASDKTKDRQEVEAWLARLNKGEQ